MAAPANYRLHVEIDAQDPAIHHNVHNKQLAGLDRPGRNPRPIPQSNIFEWPDHARHSLELA